MATTNITYTEEATTILRHAQMLAQNQKLSQIEGDEIFWGIYSFLRNTEVFDLFINMTGLGDITILDLYYQINYNIDFGHKLIKETKKLPLDL